jgi:hypothetical protein
MMILTALIHTHKEEPIFRKKDILTLVLMTVSVEEFIKQEWINLQPHLKSFLKNLLNVNIALSQAKTINERLLVHMILLMSVILHELVVNQLKNVKNKEVNDSF